VYHWAAQGVDKLGIAHLLTTVDRLLIGGRHGLHVSSGPGHRSAAPCCMETSSTGSAGSWPSPRHAVSSWCLPVDVLTTKEFAAAAAIQIVSTDAIPPTGRAC